MRRYGPCNVIMLDPHTIEACFNCNAHVQYSSKSTRRVSTALSKAWILALVTSEGPKSCLNMAPSMSSKYWVNMIDLAITFLNLNFVYVGMYYVINSTRDREEIV